MLAPEPEQARVEVAAVLLPAPVLADVAHVEDDLEAGELVLGPGGLQQLLQPRHLIIEVIQYAIYLPECMVMHTVPKKTMRWYRFKMNFHGKILKLSGNFIFLL